MPVAACHRTITALQEQVRNDGAIVLRYIRQCLDLLPPARGEWHAFKMLQAANLVPRPQLLDLLRGACAAGALADFNPFLTKQAHAALQREALLWLELCVLSDKLDRLAEMGPP